MRIKHLAFILCALLSATAVACSDDNEPSNNPAPAPAPTPTPTQQPPQEQPPSIDAQLSQLVESERSKQTLVGFSMAVARADGTSASAASGQSEIGPPGGTQKPVAPNQQTYVGSVTKTFTSIVTHQLVEEGKLSLDATVNTFLPDQPRGDKIKIRHLLAHQSGLPDYTDVIFNTPELRTRAASPWAPTELIAIANQRPVLGEPGQVTKYSNTGFIMLGVIIEKVTGLSWDENVKKRVIEPAGLTQTAYSTTPLPNAAHGYMKEEGQSTPTDVYGALHPSIGWSAGGIATSTEDLLRYTRAIFGGKLVKPESLALMMQPVGEEDRGGFTVQYGLGLMIATADGVKIYGHAGDLLGYAAFIGIRDGVGGPVVAATSNTHGADVITPSLTALKAL
jgi:D-alanyl-D-alanine carboxypeptidase